MSASYSDPKAFEPAGGLASYSTELNRADLAPRRHMSTIIAYVAAIEFLTVAAMAYLGSVAYNMTVLTRWPPADQYIPAAVLVATLVLLISLGFRHFIGVEALPRHRFLWNGIGAVTLAFSFFLSAMFLIKAADDYSRGTFLFQYLTVAIAVLSVRAIAYSRLQSAVASGAVEARHAILIGEKGPREQIDTRLRAAGIRTVGSFGLPGHSASRDAFGDESASLNADDSTKLVETCRTLRADDILILASAKDFAVVSNLADVLSDLPISLHVIPVEAGNLLASSRLSELGSIATIQVLRPPLSKFDLFLKRAFDLTVGLTGLIVLSPLLLVVALAIKLESSGPVLFRQRRHGYNNEIIRVFKFRSMTVTEDGGNFTQAVRNDTRVTRIGRVLRASSIDELPQLLNVLCGEMSIVGPRPHPIALNRMYEEQISPFYRRHNVKPGITGWAQVNGYRGETDTLEKMQRRLEYDLYYIDNWSFMLDIKIILMTLFSKRSYMNAY